MTISDAASYDVFLSYNGKDRALVQAVAERLQRAGLRPWFDQWCLTPGGQYQEELFAGLHASRACAYLVGPHGEGDWARMELDVARSRAAKERSFRLFPVLLPGVLEPFDRTTLPPFLAQRTWVDLRSGPHDRRALQSLINAIKGVAAGAATIAAEPDTGTRPPYRGLLPFGEDDAEQFFGRDADVQRLLELLRGGRFLAVLGPSGSGKSSLVRAGLVPALRAGALPESAEWPLRVMRPGALPVNALAAAAADVAGRPAAAVLDELRDDERGLHLLSEAVLADRGPAARVGWVVDQAEELFTLCHDDDERAAFIRGLVYAAAIPGGRTMAVLTMRADFYPRLAGHPELAALVGNSQYLVSPLSEEGLRAAIEEPAHRAGLTFEEGLVETILGDVRDRPGALPLLQHALLELWQRRRGEMLTLEGYREAGGVEGALAQRAEATYESFAANEREVVRRALLRLTEPGEGVEDTRRRARLRELIGGPGQAQLVEAVVNRLADTRLVTVSPAGDGQPGPASTDAWVDLSHEALIRGWPRMREWIEESRESLRVHRRITEAAADWEAAGRDPDLLYRGARLAEAVEWRQAHEAELNGLEREFLAASVAARDEAMRSRERRRRLVTAGSTATALALLVLSALAGVSWLRAEEAAREARLSASESERTAMEAGRLRSAAELAQQEAERRRQHAVGSELAAQARSRGVAPDLAILLALESARYEVPESRAALLNLLLTEPKLGIHRLGDGVVRVALSDDGRTVASAHRDGTVLVRDAITGDHVGTLDAIVVPDNLAISPTGGTVAHVGVGQAIEFWAADSDWRPHMVGDASAVYTSLSVGGDGTLIAAVANGAVIVWDVGSTETPTGRELPGMDFGERVTFSADASRLAASGFTASSGGDELGLIVWDVETGEPLFETTTGELAGGALALSADGELLASSSGSRLTIWNVESGAVLALFHTARPISTLTFSRDSTKLAGGGATLTLWEVATGATLREISGHGGQIESVAFDQRDGSLISASRVGGVIIRWDVESATQRLGSNLGAHTLLKLTADGLRALTATWWGKLLFIDPVGVWDVSAGELVAEFEGDGRRSPILGFDIDTAGSRVVTSTPSGARLLEASTGTQELVTTGEDLAWVIAVSPDGRLLATDQGGIRLLEIESGAIRQLTDIAAVLPRQEGLSFTHDGLTFNWNGEALASFETTRVRLWNTASGSLIWEWSAGDVVRSVMFSRDGSSVAVASESLTILHAATGRVLHELIGHAGPIESMAYSRDGKMLASAARDRQIIVWGLETGQALVELAVPPESPAVHSLAFRDDGTLVAAARTTLWTFDLDLIRLTERACVLAGRNLTRDEWRRYVGDEPYRATCP